jgi:hypothetical protein
MLLIHIGGILLGEKARLPILATMSLNYFFVLLSALDSRIYLLLTIMVFPRTHFSFNLLSNSFYNFVICIPICRLVNIKIILWLIAEIIIWQYLKYEMNRRKFKNHYWLYTHTHTHTHTHTYSMEYAINMSVSF